MKKLFIIPCLCLLASCGTKKSVDADDAVLAAAASHPGEWLTHGLNYSEDRFGRLTQINRENVNTLGLAWVTDLDSKRGLEATPLIADGVMYLHRRVEHRICAGCCNRKAALAIRSQGAAKNRRTFVLRYCEPRRGAVQRQDLFRHLGRAVDYP